MYPTYLCRDDVEDVQVARSGIVHQLAAWVRHVHGLDQADLAEIKSDEEESKDGGQRRRWNVFNECGRGSLS